MHKISRGTFLMAASGAAFAAAESGGGKGKWHPSEARTFRDPDTGREVTQLTNSSFPSSNLYFTAQSFTANNRGLVFMSSRPKKSELYLAELPSGRFQQLTESETGAYHACVCQKASTVAYLDNGAVWIVDLHSLEQRKLYTIPQGHQPDLLSIDDSGRYIAFAHCTPLAKPVARDQTHHSWLVRINTDGSGHQLVREEDFWISHVLINPTDPDTILFCHEGSWEVVAQRLWVVRADGSGLRKLRVEEDPEVAIGHEIWTERGGAVNYHGSYKRRAFLGRVSKDGSLVHEYTMTAPAGHTSATEDGRLVLGDGTVEYPYISLYHFKGSVAIADPLCQSGRMTPAGLHAHANFSADGEFVVFGSERGGQNNVFLVKTGA